MSKRAKREAHRHRMADEQHKEDVRHVMRTEAGRRFVWWIIDELAGLHGETFTGNSQTFHLEGKRSIGVKLMQETGALAPADYVHMVREALESTQREDAVQQAPEVEAETENDGD